MPATTANSEQTQRSMNCYATSFVHERIFRNSLMAYAIISKASFLVRSCVTMLKMGTSIAQYRPDLNTLPSNLITYLPGPLSGWPW